MDPIIWNNLIQSFPEPHFLQSWQWGEVKSQYGWKPHHLSWNNASDEINAAALILERQIRPLPFLAPLKMFYIPKGPMIKNWEDGKQRSEILNKFVNFAREQGAFMIKIDPDIIIGTGIPGEDGVENAETNEVLQSLTDEGWKPAPQQIQFKNTAVIELAGTEEELLAAMKQKTRYNIRLAERKGVVVRHGTAEDFHQLYQLYAETSLRGGFVIRSEAYYQTVWQTFMDAGLMTPIIAEVDGEMTAGLILFFFGKTAYYFYGMSGSKHRKLMPAYALQWEAIKLAKSRDCTKYDLWGAPDTFNSNDPMWGVFRIKTGLGGKVVRAIGAYDFVIKPFQYWLYTTILPQILKLMRRSGNAQTRQNVSGDS